MKYSGRTQKEVCRSPCREGVVCAIPGGKHVAAANLRGMPEHALALAHAWGLRNLDDQSEFSQRVKVLRADAVRGKSQGSGLLQFCENRSTTTRQALRVHGLMRRCGMQAGSMFGTQTPRNPRQGRCQKRLLIMPGVCESQGLWLARLLAAESQSLIHVRFRTCCRQQQHRHR